MCTNCYKRLDFSSDSKHLDLFRVSLWVSIKASSITIQLSFPQVDNAVFYKCLQVGICAYCCHMWLILLRLK